jgi:hypothetical protein
MLRSLDEVRGYNIYEKDGDMGVAHDFYFDDREWTIRYLIVDTGFWLPGRQVLISPAAIRHVDWDKGRLELNLTKEQVENSPDIVTERPVSRQQEAKLVAYYRWPVYWDPFVGGITPAVLAVPQPASEDPADKAAEEGDPHLRSVKEVTGYSIEATDGSIGHVEEFIADDDNWAIRYMVVDTRNWLPGKKVLVSPHWIRSISWAQRSVHVELTREAIKRAPEYDPSMTVHRDYEDRLHAHYDLPKYWE